MHFTCNNIQYVTFTWTSSERKTHNQTYHVWIDKRRHASILMCDLSEGLTDTDNYFVVTKVKERLAVS
jgi:hypothetical protein